jgi:hypothetical protein
MHTPSALPVTGGIVKIPARDTVPVSKQTKAQSEGDMAHAAEGMKAQTNTAMAR